MFYKHYQQKPLSEANKVTSQFSEVQSGLCQTVRQIVQNPIAFGQGHQAYDSDVIPPQYDNQSYTELFKRYQALREWAKSHPDEINSLNETPQSEKPSTDDGVEPSK